MRKILINSVLLIPIVIYGCFEGDLTRKGEHILPIQENELTKLDVRSVSILNNYGSTIKKYSELYGVDWRLVVAVMKQESQFNHSVSSPKGAEGFMQIMPATQLQIAKEIGVDTTHLEDPHGNIRGGIYYLAKLYRTFDRKELSEENKLKLTLASYNAGLGRVLDARKMAEYVNDDPNEWKSVKNSLSLLSKKYSSLHKYVWEEKRPSSGYFKDWQQTSNYVESVIAYYTEYKKVLNSNV